MNLIKLDTPISKHLTLKGYYKKYREVWFEPINEDNSLSEIYGKFAGGFLRLPEGISGEKLLTLKLSLSAEYKKLEGKNDSLQECIKRGAL